MEYTDKEIQAIHNKGYVQAMTHAIKMFREYPYLNALKIVQNLKDETEKQDSNVNENKPSVERYNSRARVDLNEMYHEYTDNL